MYLSFLVTNLEGLHVEWTGNIIRWFKSNPKMHQNRFVEMPIPSDGSFVPVVFSKFNSKYRNNFNCSHFGGHVDTRSGIDRRILNSTQKNSDDLLCHFWM